MIRSSTGQSTKMTRRNNKRQNPTNGKAKSTARWLRLKAVPQIICRITGYGNSGKPAGKLCKCRGRGNDSESKIVCGSSNSFASFLILLLLQR